MRQAAWLPMLLLLGCGSEPQTAAPDTAGARLEAAAEQAGLVVDPAAATLVGSWARDTDRLCVTPRGRDRFGVGVLIDYGPGQGCVASGTVRRRGDRLTVDLGACAFDAHFDGERIAFPAELPAACDRLCTGHATLAALSVEHLSTASSEAETLRAPGGRLLCPTGE